MTIGERIKAIRESKGITQNALADIIHVSPSYIILPIYQLHMSVPLQKHWVLLHKIFFAIFSFHPTLSLPQRRLKL